MGSSADRNVLLFVFMTDINNLICSYITKEWLIPWLKENKSQISFAKDHRIEESTIRKIKSEENYRIPVETLYKICEARKISLSEFFKLINE
jgi:DNA-binding Xre family transcriptional regulator